MCGGKKSAPAPAPDPLWKTASAKDTANRGQPTGDVVDPSRRVGATDGTGTLGNPLDGGPTTSVLGG